MRMIKIWRVIFHAYSFNGGIFLSIVFFDYTRFTLRKDWNLFCLYNWPSIR